MPGRVFLAKVIVSALGIATLLVVGFTLSGAQASGQRPGPTVIPSNLGSAPQTNGLFRLLVTVKVNYRPEGNLSPQDVQVQRAAIQTAQNSLLSTLAGRRYNLIAQYQIFPIVALETDAAT